MADVTGSIGTEYVELNNAATEATLKQLLAATLKMGGSAGKVGSLAGAAGMDPAAIKNANEGLKETGETGKQNAGIWETVATAGSETATKIRGLDDAVSPLIGKLIQGTAQASDLFASFEKLPGMLGVFATGLKRVAEFQEQNLITYQDISDAGVSFGGSLTQMRMAASNTYMTLEKFSELIRRNSETFAKMGGTANDGAKAFASLSNSLLKSEAGDSLRNLGYTTDQVNQGLASYISMTGGRNAQELKNTKDITNGATAYLSQLDALAEITGKSREEQQKELQEKMKNAQFEAKLQGMSEEEKKKATIGLANALAVGGKGAADAFQSKIMGVPPLTKEAQMFTATMSKTNESVMRSANNVSDSSKSVNDQNKELVNGIRANEQDVKKFGSATAYAMGVMGSEAGKTITEGQARANRSAQQSDESLRKAIDIDAKKQELADSEAADAVNTQKAMQEMGQSIMSSLLPVIKLLTNILNPFVQVIGAVAKQFEKLPGILQLVIAGGLAYLAFKKVKETREAAAGIVGGASGIGGLGKGPLGSSGNPMHVIIAGNSASNALGDVLDKDGKGNKSPKDNKNSSGTPDTSDGKKGGKFGKLKGLGLGLAGGIAGDLAADYFGRDSTAGKTADTLGTAASWAGMGAMLGPMGALAGGVAGAGYGAYQNFFGEKKAADGAVVSNPTNITAGEAGPEIISPIKYFNNLQSELETLNKQTMEMIRYMKETAEYTRRTHDATKSLGGDLFKF